MADARSDDYRYTVEVNGAEITPLAAVEAFVGTARLRVLNISIGGVALLFDREPQLSRGDILDISISIRDRPFPVQIDVRGLQGLRAHCQFLNPSRLFQGALREFLRPKFLGGTLRMTPTLSGRADVLELVAGAEVYEAYLGQNQTGVFVWTNGERELFKIVAVSQDLIFEWSQERGVRTGHIADKNGSAALNPAADLGASEGITWSRLPESALMHYFADVLLSWLRVDAGPAFVERLLSEEMLTQTPPAIRFPVPPVG